MTTIAALLIATLLGGMAWFSFGFAALMFHLFDTAEARRALRGSFPWYYAAVIGLATLAALASLPIDRLAAAILAGTAVTTLYARQDLMPRINAATDAGAKRRFDLLHGASVALQLVQLVAVAIALARFT
ncbi:MAG: DUF4149 domain-containing protein [Shimia sp.]